MRRGGGRLVATDGCCRTGSTEWLAAPGIGEKLPGARVWARPEGGGGGACPGCIVVGVLDVGRLHLDSD
jgi:hypothetical protein